MRPFSQSRNRRSAFTLIELMVVLVMLVVLGAVIVPTLQGMYGNSRQKASADLIRSRIAMARAKAMETGMWIRIAINSDNKRIRVGPDCQNFDNLQPGDSYAPNSMVTEDHLEEGVTARITLTDSSQASNSWTQVSTGGGGGSSSTGSSTPSGSDEWNTIVTVGPEGICREGLVRLCVDEGKFKSIYIEVRGIVASSSIILSNEPPGNGK